MDQSDDQQVTGLPDRSADTPGPASPVGRAGPAGSDGAVDRAGPATALDLLDALRSYRSVESRLRKELSQRLNVNETDLAALRYLIGVWDAEEDASPKELALALGISSASTTLVIDRLERAGFITRRRHPSDRRAVLLEPGEKATDGFRDSFDAEKRGVLAAAEELTDDETETVTHFLRSMARAVPREVEPEATRRGQSPRH